MLFPQEKHLTFLGMTFFNKDGGAQEIRIMLQEANSPILDDVRLVPTLLHEFAHVLRERERSPSENIQSSTRKRKLKRLCHSFHDDAFYECFKRLLLIAEDLQIYFLPPIIGNKFSPQSLRTFDKIDLAVCPLDQCGTTNAQRDQNIAPVPKTTVRVLFCLASKPSIFKPVFLEIDKWTPDQVMGLANQKFNAKPKLSKCRMNGVLWTKTQLRDGKLLLTEECILQFS